MWVHSSQDYPLSDCENCHQLALLGQAADNLRGSWGEDHRLRKLMVQLEAFKPKKVTSENRQSLLKGQIGIENGQDRVLNERIHV